MDGLINELNDHVIHDVLDTARCLQSWAPPTNPSAKQVGECSGDVCNNFAEELLACVADLSAAKVRSNYSDCQVITL